MSLSDECAAMDKSRCRILIAKLGLDGHDRGAKYVARGLRDRGYEVIYTGIRHSPAEVAAVAIQEDVRFVGVSTLSGGHALLLPRLITLLKEGGGEDILVFAGGIIPLEDAARLREAGVSEVFGPGTTIDKIESFIEGCLHGFGSTGSGGHPR